MCQRNRSNGETVTRSNEYLMKIKQYSHSLTTHDVSEFPQILGKCDSSLRSNNNDISAFPDSWPLLCELSILSEADLLLEQGDFSQD